MSDKKKPKGRGAQLLIPILSVARLADKFASAPATAVAFVSHAIREVVVGTSCAGAGGLLPR